MPSLTERVNAAVRAFRGLERSSPPIGEIAFADPKRLFPGGYLTPYNPSALIGVKGMKVIDRMRVDDQIKASMSFKKGAVLATGWEVASPKGQSPEWEVTRFVQTVLNQVEGTLQNDLWEIMSALDYGFSVTEKVWDIVQDGPFTGRVGLKALKTRKPHDFDFDADEYGNLKQDGVIQHNRFDKQERLPADRFILFAYDEEFSNKYGRSDLEAAYRHWWSKENVLKWLVLLCEKLGIPPIFFLYDPGKLNPVQIDELKDLVRNLQAGSSGLIPRSGGKDAMDAWSPELAGQAPRVFIPALEYYDRAIARAILMPGLLGLTGDASFGSFARARVSFDVFLLIVEKLRNDLERLVMQEQVIKPLVDFNYTVEEYPAWRFHPLTDEVRLDIFDRWMQAVDSGVVQRRKEDEPFIRRVLRFPTSDSAVVPDPRTPPEGAEESENDDPSEENLRSALAETRDMMVQFVARNYAQAGPSVAEMLQVKNLDGIRLALYEHFRVSEQPKSGVEVRELMLRATKTAERIRDRILDESRRIVREGGSAQDVLGKLRQTFDSMTTGFREMLLEAVR